MVSAWAAENRLVLGQVKVALKENHGRLYEDVVKLFADLEASEFKAYPYSQAQTVNKNHGRLETRTCQVIAAQDILMQLRDAPEWPGLRAVVRVHARRQKGDEVTAKERYFVSSLDSHARRLLKAVRSHWGIENELHWVLDIAFREDESRICKDHGPEFFQVFFKKTRLPYSSNAYWSYW